MPKGRKTTKPGYKVRYALTPARTRVREVVRTARLLQAGRLLRRAVSAEAARRLQSERADLSDLLRQAEQERNL